VRTMRGALLALAIGIIVGVGAALQFGMSPTGGTPGMRAAVEPAPLPKAVPPPAPAALAAPAVADPAGVPAVTALPDFATLAERLSPVVVNISTRAQRKEQQPDAPRFRGPGQPGPQ
jgi:hypothetical protein